MARPRRLRLSTTVATTALLGTALLGLPALAESPQAGADHGAGQHPGGAEGSDGQHHEGDDGDRNKAENGPLSVKAAPAIIAAGGTATIRARYETGSSGSEGDVQEHGDQGESGSAPGTGSGDGRHAPTPAPTGSPASAAGDSGGSPTAAPTTPSPSPSTGPDVTFEVDFGDGSPAVSKPGTTDADEAGEVVLRLQHTYAAAGRYTATVTARPATGSPVSVTVDVQVGDGAARLGGQDRYDTAVQLAGEDFPEDGGAGAVVLARANAFADALSSAPLAELTKAPVLLTASDTVPPPVLREIKRLLGDTGTVYLLGGTGAISAQAEQQVAALGYSVVRLGGQDRVATALAVFQQAVAQGADVRTVVLAGDRDYPDALSGAAYAAGRGLPVLLTGGAELDPRVADALRSLPAGSTVVVPGGKAAVSDAVLEQLRRLNLTVERLAGAGRYETSAAVAAGLFPDATSVVLATGKDFPDALAGAAHAGRVDAPVLLVGDQLPAAVADYLRSRAGKVKLVYVLGGTGAVPTSVLTQAQALLAGTPTS